MNTQKEPLEYANEATSTQMKPPGLFVQWWKGKKFYGLVLASGQCGLTFEERMAWSYILYRTQKSGTTIREIAKATGLGRVRTIPGVKESLIAKQLVTIQDGRLFALEPQPDQKNWFSWRPNTALSWYERLRSFPICHTPITWTAKQTAIYFCLLTGNIQSGRKINHNQKKTGIAALLHISHDTVERTYKMLEGLGLIEYNYLLQPTDEIRNMFESRLDNPAYKKWLASDACEWNFGGMQDGSAIAKFVDLASDRMIADKYTRDEVLAYLDYCYAEVASRPRGAITLWRFFANWDELYQRVEADTMRNRNDGKYRGRSGLGLLKIESGRAIAIISDDTNYIRLAEN